MAVTNIELLSGPFYPNGATTAFGFNFRVLSKPELIVWRGEPGAWVQVDPALYSVNIGTTEGGSVVFDVPPAAGAPLYIEGDPDFTQDSAFGGGEAPFTPKAINTELERGALRSATRRDGVQRAITVPRGELAVDLPPAAQRAGRFLAFGPTGDAIPASGVGADAALRPDLANPAMGSALVAFRQSGAGTVTRSAQDKARETISVIDFGAKGDGVTDDWAAFNAALVAAANTVSYGGINSAVGGEVVVPYRPNGYILGQTLTVPLGVRLRFMAGRQVITKTHSSTMYLLKDGSQIDGGDHRGGNLPGNCFRLESANSGQGRQRISNLRAATGWADEVLYYELEGGSQSSVTNCILATNSGKYAVKVADGFKDSAVPRKLHNIETNGTLGFDFGASNDTMVSDSFCGGVRFTMDSRGVHLSGVRIANQPTVNVKGHNHVFLGGWNPVPTFKSEPDFQGNPAQTDLVVWNGYCNSGRPLDESGNARNSITYPEYPIIPVLRSDTTALTLTSYRDTWGIKRSGTTYTFRLDLSCNLTGGAATPGGMGSGFLYIDLPVGAYNWGAEQPVMGLMMEYSVSGTQAIRPIIGRVLPRADAATPGTRVQLYDMNFNPITGGQAPGGVPTAGWVLTRIRGQIEYSPA